MSILIETTIGNIVIDLFTLENPTGTYNFLKLCKINFYQHQIIYRILKNYAIQFGDPTLGKGGNSFEGIQQQKEHHYIECKCNKLISNNQKYIVGFVSHGNNTIGSEIYITTSSKTNNLKGIPIGKVEEGQEIIEQLNKLLVDENNRPYQNIRIVSTIILEDPFDDPENMIIPQENVFQRDDHPEYIECQLNKSNEKNTIEKQMKENEARSQAQVLEMIGDLPFADIKPPETVLFICQLNGCTTEKDLKEIFQQFGKLISVDIIKDKKSQQSLGYGFIEFETKEDCEYAYEKMKNAIIDDRRIHLDFSQSIGKFHNQRNNQNERKRNNQHLHQYHHSKRSYNPH